LAASGVKGTPIAAGAGGGGVGGGGGPGTVNAIDAEIQARLDNLRRE